MTKDYPKYSELYNKSEKMKEWEDKGIEWLSEKLWEARTRIHDLTMQINDRDICTKECVAEDMSLRDANQKLTQILKENGICPQKLIVTYTESKCKGYEEDYCGDFNCDGYGSDCEICELFHKYKHTKTISFYTWEVTDDELIGISNTFKEYDLDILQIIDAQTRILLYKAEGK